MAFLLTCPNCGERNVYDFRAGGEVVPRPAPDATAAEWAHYSYARRNVAGEQREWWYHALGCRRWFIAIRDTVNNQVRQTYWPEETRG